MATSSSKAIVSITVKEDGFTMLKDVNGEFDHCVIKVKVMLLWKPFFNEYQRGSSSIEMILIDEQGYKIVATIRKADFKIFESRVKEGGFYVISNFRVASYSSVPKMVDHASKINFFQNTKLEATNDFIPQTSEYNIVNFDDVNYSRVNKDVAFDVIGRLISSNDLKILKSKGKDKPLLNCELQNLSGERVTCTLWDDYARKLHKFIQDNQSSNDPIVVFLQFAKFNDFNGKIGVSNMYSGTRLYINEPVDPILKFIESLKAIEEDNSSLDIVGQLSTSIAISNVANYFNSFDAKHIDEVLDADEPLDCVILANIIKIEDDQGWFYMACRNCSTIVEEQPVGSTYPYVCKNCEGVSDVYPRMRLYIRVQDGSDTLTIKMFQKEVEKLINRSSKFMYNQMRRSPTPDQLPSDFTKLLNKVYVFKIRVSDWNIEKKYYIFNVNAFTDDEETMEKISLRLPSGEPITSEAETPLAIMDASQDNNDSKEAYSVTADNGTPIEKFKSTADSPGVKRKIEDMDLDVHLQSSSSKSLTFDDKIKIPKLEKD